MTTRTRGTRTEPGFPLCPERDIRAMQDLIPHYL